MFETCLALPQNPNEARLLAEALEALARALREWPTEAWHKLAIAPTSDGGMFERLAARVAPLALKPPQRTATLESAEAAAGVLRCLWPEADAVARIGSPVALATT
jgi:hypothetical protein